VLAQGYCDFQDNINNGAYTPDFSVSDMEVVIGTPDPSSLQWFSFSGIQSAILSNINAHVLKALAELKTLIPDVPTRSAVLQQLTNLKQTFEMQDYDIMSAYIQSCTTTPLVTDPTLNQQIVAIIQKYFDFDYMQTSLSFEDLQSLGVFS
jgi:hypothetical protein